MQYRSTFILLFVFASLYATGQQKWQTYTSKLGNFKVQMPANADVQKSDNSANLQTEKIQVKDGDLLFVASVTLHDNELTETNDLAQVSLDSFAETMGGRKTGQEVWKVKKQEGIMATIELDGGVIVYFRVLIHGYFQYQVVAVDGTGSKESSKSIKKFFKSFKID